jgi:succinyl-CoA synthetase beta subunit
MDIRGPRGEGPFTVHQVWIEGASEIEAEYYASIILDRSAKKLMTMLSTMGGMNVEEIADKDPEALVRRHVEPGEGFGPEQAAKLAEDARVNEDAREKTSELMVKLFAAFNAADATLIEVNPLVVTKSGEVIALDSKVTIDNSALFRHQELAELEKVAVEDPQEQMAKERGLTYVKLDGDIGILGNGAGLCMSTLDVVAQAGGDPANFLDAGGGSKADAIVDALEVITSDPKVVAILFNIFGGITRCDEVARGIIEASGRVELKVPLVVRLDGTNSEEGLGLLADADLPNLHVEKTMLGAASSVVELAGPGAKA